MWQLQTAEEHSAKVEKTENQSMGLVEKKVVVLNDLIASWARDLTVFLTLI